MLSEGESLIRLLLSYEYTGPECAGSYRWDPKKKTDWVDDKDSTTSAEA